MTPRLTRRTVLTATASVGLLLAVGGAGLVWRRNSRWRPQALGQQGWLAIAPDGTVTLLTTIADLGQGAASALAEVVAAELGVDWAKMRLGPLPVQPAMYGSAGYSTGGSSSVRRLYRPLRTMAAAARTMLVEAAAARWNVAPAQCIAADSQVRHVASERSLGYGELAAAASLLQPPRAPKFVQRAAVARSRPRLDVPAKVDGSTCYGFDFRLPGMLYAAVSTAPFSGSQLAQPDEAAALATPGVRRVIRIEDGVAVLAVNSFAALRGLDALRPAWKPQDAARQQSLRALATLDELHAAALPAASAAGAADGPRAAQDADRRSVAMSAAVPALAHMALEPVSAVAHVTAGKAEIWISTQVADTVRSQLAAQLKLPPDAVTVNPLPAGGGFGRRLDSAYVAQVAEVAVAVAAPVKVFWSRAEDTANTRFRPAAVASASATIDRQGRLHDATLRAAALGGRERTDGLRDHPYRDVKFALQASHVDTPMRVGPWRSVDYSQNVFFLESFVDACARAQGIDALALRRQWLGSNSRALRVLEQAGAAAQWSRPLPSGRGRGIAITECFDSVIAVVIEVSMRDAQRVHVERIWAAADAGLVLSPDGVRAQLSGGITFALGAAMEESVVLEQGVPAAVNFDRYPILRFPLAPPIEILLTGEDAELPGGVGELGVPAVAPALVAAIAAAGGPLVQRLPLVASGLAFA